MPEALLPDISFITTLLLTAIACNGHEEQSLRYQHPSQKEYAFENIMV